MRKNKKKAWLEFCVKYGNKCNIGWEHDGVIKLILDAYFIGAGVSNVINQDEKYPCSINNLCHYCKKPIRRVEDAEITKGLWSDLWIKYHKTCEHLHKESVVEQQKIDCLCNDCAYFDRHPKEKSKDYCTKLNKQVKSHPMVCVNDECFVHRGDK